MEYSFDAVYFTIRGGSRKKIAKKRIPNVPIKRNVYTIASMYVLLLLITPSKEITSYYQAGDSRMKNLPNG